MAQLRFLIWVRFYLSSQTAAIHLAAVRPTTYPATSGLGIKTVFPLIDARLATF